MKSMPRGAFPTESRKVIGADDGGYRSHILAFCCKCGAEGALPCAKHSNTVPGEAGQQMFRNRGWKMAPNNRSRDVCPLCAGKARIASAPEDRREGETIRLIVDLVEVTHADPNYMGQREYANLLRDFPELTEAAEQVVQDWIAQDREPITDTFARIDAVVQAALTRLRKADDADAAMLGEIDKRIAELYTLMAESNERKARDLQDRDALEAAQTIQEDTPMTPRSARTDTALGSAFLKAQTDKIKKAGAQRPPRTAAEQAALDKLIAAQVKDDRRGVKEVGAKRKTPMPPPAQPVAPAAAKTVTAARTEDTPPVPARKAPNRAKRTGGWDDMSPEEHAERVARMTIKRNLAYAQKAGLTLEEWTRRNESRKAESEARRKAKSDKAPALRLVEPSPKPAAPKTETPMPAKSTPVLIHDNTINPTSAGVLDRIRITETLRAHYVPITSDGEGGYYQGDLSDARLGEMLDMPAAWIAERREVLLFGEDVNEHTAQDTAEVEALLGAIRDLKTLQEKLFDAGAQEVSAIAQRQAELLERIQQDTKQMLDDASEKVANSVAGIEDRVVEIEQRVRALSARR